jgi:hypothetical protein
MPALRGGGLFLSSEVPLYGRTYGSKRAMEGHLGLRLLSRESERIGEAGGHSPACSWGACTGVLRS